MDKSNLEALIHARGENQFMLEAKIFFPSQVVKHLPYSIKVGG
jgi:hypothetical protein